MTTLFVPTYCFYAYERINENSTEFILYALMIGINMVDSGSRLQQGLTKMDIVYDPSEKKC